MPASALALALLAAASLVLSLRGPTPADAPTAPTAAAPSPPDPHRRELDARFHQAAVLLQARQHEEALQALARVLALAPRLPEAHVNRGYALLGLQQPAAARMAFEQALDIRPGQANAYYGLAMALEQQGELDTALGAMRSYLHLSRADDPHRARARAALWEWEQRLGRPGPAR
jgi:tetratricopeptide (TPR) repeat protein